jgi:hypothetical protein
MWHVTASVFQRPRFRFPASGAPAPCGRRWVSHGQRPGPAATTPPKTQSTQARQSPRKREWMEVPGFAQADQEKRSGIAQPA